MDRLEEWIFNQHRNTNHKYDGYLPYEFHLKMVKNIGNQFFYLLPKMMFTETIPSDREYYESKTPIVVDRTKDVLELACYGHDLIEDTRVSYNDVKSKLREDAANIIYSLTNEKGKNRAERASDKYYQGIIDTPGAVFVKLCDRIANVKYSKDSGSSMFKTYQKENDNFLNKLELTPVHELHPMVDYLINLLK